MSDYDDDYTEEALLEDQQYARNCREAALAEWDDLSHNARLFWQRRARSDYYNARYAYQVLHGDIRDFS
jgi:hypothetical protein